MKILVTGATGFIGSNLVTRLTQSHQVSLIVRPESHIPWTESEIDLFRYGGDTEALTAYFERQQFDGVIHLASLFLAAHTPADIPDLVNSNILFGTELLEASKRSGVTWFLNTGTFWQHYENEPYNPVNLYAATKEAFSVMARYYTETSDLIFTTIKLSDTFGPGDTRNKVFNLWAKIAGSGEHLEMSPGDQIIDISYIDDVIDAFERMVTLLGEANAREFKNRTFGVSSAERMPLKALAKCFEAATGTTLDIHWGGRAYREREVMVPWEDAEPVPGWQPKQTLHDAIIKTMGANE